MDTYYPDYNIDLNDFPRGLPDEVMDMLNPKKHRRDVLVEDCYILRLSDFGKGLLKPVNQWTEGYAKPLDEQVEPKGKHGQFILAKPFGILKLDYSVDLSQEPFILNLGYSYRNCWHNQAIDLGQSYVSYGTRPFLLCPCGIRCNQLYLSPKQYSFYVPCLRRALL